MSTETQKDYCTQNNGDCETCSLVNYGRDCRNNPINPTTDTTGQLIMAYTGPCMTEIIIALDSGQYPGTKPELNVRQLEILDRHKKTSGPTIKQVTNKAGYGCGWGETSKLYPITSAQANQIRVELSQTDEKTTEPVKMPAIDNMICPNCGTVCYGDCQAN